MTKPSPDSGKRATPADHAKGHRARMRGKLLEKGSAALTELEILEMLLYVGAPRGDTKPSRADIEVTKDIKKALAVMGIALHDHLIVAGTSCVSFKSLGHL
jgi:DNA repair protein RadC